MKPSRSSADAAGDQQQPPAKVPDAAEADDSTSIISPQGDVDIATAPNLEEDIRAALESSTSVVIDLSGVTFMDSSGIAVLIRAADTAANRNAVLRVRSSSGQVRRLLELTGLIDRFLS